MEKQTKMSNFEFSSRIRYSETGPDSRLTIESLINYFQDCSTFQTEESGAGLESLKEQNLAWMLLSWQIDISRLPKLYEEVRIGTIPYELKGMMGLRNYYMDTAAGERLATANSVWVLINTETMGPVRITEEHKSHYIIGERLEMNYADRKIRFDTALPHTEATPVQIHANQLDSNHHVNNGRYVRMAIDAVVEKVFCESKMQSPAESGADESLTKSATLKQGDVIKTKTSLVLPGGLDEAESLVRHVQAEYKKQAHLGDELVPVLYRLDDHTVIVDLLLAGESSCTVKIGI